MRIVTSGEMYRIEEAAEKRGVSRRILMENAGKNIARNLANLFPDYKKKNICILCGKGNNGGDGLVAARYLKKMGAHPSVSILGRIHDISPLARENLSRLKKLKVRIHEIVKAEQIAEEIKNSSILIDAIFGTGFKGEIKGLYADVIDLLSFYTEGRRPSVVAVDLPSGMDADTGKISSPQIRADWTFTLGLPKKGLFLHPGIEYAGNILVLDIGIPQEIIGKGWLNLLSKEEISGFFPPRNTGAHKGSFGHTFILAGSPGFTGAAALAGTAALWSGAGLVTVGIPESLNTIMSVKLTEAMTKPFPETRAQTLGLKSFKGILEFSKKVDVLAIGPGLSRVGETRKLILKVIENINLPMVIDADALFALRGHTDILKRRRSPAVLTPHPGEMVYLTGKSLDWIQSHRIEYTRDFAVEFKVITILKGARTVIASPSGEVWVNPTGNPGMATGGSGDVLTGIIASLTGQGLNLLNASKAGVFLHGLAGDIAREEKGEYSLVASDIITKLPQAFKNVVL